MLAFEIEGGGGQPLEEPSNDITPSTLQFCAACLHNLWQRRPTCSWKRLRPLRDTFAIVTMTVALAVFEADESFTTNVLLIVSLAYVYICGFAVGKAPAGKALAVLAISAVSATVYLILLSAKVFLAGLEAHEQEFKDAVIKLGVFERSGDRLGPASMRRPPQELMQKASKLEELLARAKALHPALEEAVMMRIVQGGLGRGSGRTMIAGVKGRARSAEKIRKDYNGDAAQLKDALRGTVICKDLEDMAVAAGQVLLLEREGVIKLLQVENRFRDGAVGGGYMDINMNVLFQGMVCEVQFNMQCLIDIKEGERPIYETSRAFGLIGDLPETLEPLDQAHIGLWRWVFVAFRLAVVVLSVGLLCFNLFPNYTCDILSQ